MLPVMNLLGIGSGDDAIEHAIYCGEFCHLGGDIAIIGETVATHGESNTTWVALFWAKGSDNMKVCCLSVLGDGQNWEKEHVISASGHVGAVSLAEVAYFIGASIDPELALTAGAQLMILSNQPCIRFECIAVKCLVGIEWDAFTSGQCFIGCCSNVMELGVGTCGMRVGWWCSCLQGGRFGGSSIFMFAGLAGLCQQWCPARPVLFW